MNWTKLIVFLIFIVYFYHLFGTGLFSFFKIENKSFAKRILTGFLGLTCIQWFIGFMSQVVHVSWNVYFVILLTIYTFLFLFLLKQHGIKKSSKHMLLNSLQNFLKQYWFVIFLTLSLAFWSMSSQLPYLLLNYDDHYYLGAMVQQIGSDALSTVNYFNGTPMDVGITRLINTFEINYGFWSSLFQINAAFFARAVMVIHNYFMIFIAIIAFGESFNIIKLSYVQYVLLPFAIFMIPSIYLKQNLSIDLYDSWQMNTAIWYGGSLVRVISLPVCLIYLRDFIEDYNWKKWFYMSMPFMAFISFSSVFVPIAIISIGMGFLYGLWVWYDKHNTRKNFIVAGIVVICMLFGIKLAPRLLELIRPSLTQLFEGSGSVWSQVNVFSSHNYLFIFLSASMLFASYKLRKEPIYKVSLILSAVCILLYIGLFNKFFLTISTGFDFVLYRLVTSIQLLLLMLCSILVIWYVSKRVSKRMCVGVALVFTLFLHGVNIKNLEAYKSPNTAGLGTGLSIYGYSPSRVFKNQYMTPSFYVEFNTYFESLDKGRYRIISPQVIPYEDGTHFIGASLATLANNVESCVSYDNVRCDDIDAEIVSKFVQFAEGTLPYEEVLHEIEKYNISYMITINSMLKDDLVKKGFKLVSESYSLSNDSIYLLKLK